MAFKEWAVAEGLVTEATVSQLKGRTVAIDAEDYIHGFLTGKFREPLLPALGGLPFGLAKYVESDLANLRDAEITPVYVFNGLDLRCRDQASILRDSRKASVTLGEAWETYDSGKAEEAVTAFGKACTYRTYPIMRKMQSFLHRLGASVQVAPYTAAAQMVYLENDNFIDAVAGSASCLLFGAPRVILDFDWSRSVFNFVDISKSLSKLNMSSSQFTDLCLVSGSSILPNLPEIDAEAGVSRMQAARSFVKTAGNDSAAVHNQIKDEAYKDLFIKARAALRHAPRLTRDGKVELADQKMSPGDSHDFIGQRLPEEIYYYLSRGLVGPRPLNWRTRMELLETPPLDGGASQTYKDLVQEKLRPLRTQTLAIMTSSLNRYYQKQDVGLSCWWMDTKTPLGIEDKTDATRAADSWHVKIGSIPPPEGTASSLLYDAISAFSKSDFGSKTVTPRENGAGAQLKEPKEVQANAIWRFLEDRAYIQSDHTLSAWGRALKVALDRAMGADQNASEPEKSEIQEAVLLAFELLRLDVLNAKYMFNTPPYSGPPIRGSETDKSHTLLISRIASLGTFSHEKIGYTGPLSRHLLAYQQVAATVRGALRDLLEMHTCHMFLSGAVERNLSNTELSDIGASLPWLDEPDLGLALVVKSHLDELSNDNGRRADISRWFNHALDIEGDLQKAWRMWDAVNAGVQAGDNNIISADTKRTFKVADEWLKLKRQQSLAPNGTA